MSEWKCASCSAGTHYCDWFNSDMSSRCVCDCGAGQARSNAVTKEEK
jgi:hypothetical protein